MGEPGRLSLDESDRFSDDSERLVCSRFDCFVILRKRELRFLLGDKEGATYPSPNSGTPRFSHFRAARPPTLPGPSLPSCNPPIRTERTFLAAGPIRLLPPQAPPIPSWTPPPQAKKTFLKTNFKKNNKQTPTFFWPAHLSSSSVSSYSPPNRAGRNSPDPILFSSSLESPLKDASKTNSLIKTRHSPGPAHLS